MEEDNAQPAAQQPSVSSVPIFETIRTPSLKSASPHDVLLFLKDRETYLQAVEARNAEPEVNIVPLPLKSCVPVQLQKHLRYLDLIKVPEGEDIKDEHIEDFLKRASKRSVNQVDGRNLQKLVSSIRFQTKEPDAGGRILALATEYMEKLSDHGYADFWVTNPQAAIAHLQSKLQPPELVRRMEADFKVNPELKKRDFKRYVQHLYERAKLVDEAFVSDPRDKKRTRSRSPRRDQSRFAKRQRDGKERKDRGHKKAEDGATPQCLNPKCRERHFVRDCPKTSEAERTELIRKFKENKARERKNSGAKKGTPSWGSA